MSEFRRPLALYLAVALLGLGTAAAEPAPDSLDTEIADALVGRVTSAARPLESAWVYAYQIADFSLRKVVTSKEGVFHFTDLPAGLYKIIAFKAGFVPAIAMLSRSTAGSTQAIDLDLAPEPEGERVETGFWALRERIPSDVLRDIQAQGLREEIGGAGLTLPEAQLRAEMQAMAGVQEGLEYGQAQVSGGRLGIDGRIRDYKIGLKGRYSELEADSGHLGAETASGRTQWFTVQVENSESSRLDISTLNNRLVTFHDGAVDPVDFESHSVSWSQRIGDESRSDFSAQYVSESNFHRQSALAPAEIPSASRALRLEGSYTTPLSERATIQAGFRYRELETDLTTETGAEFELLPNESVELFGRGGVRVKPALVVEYGLYSKLRDGTVSLVPQGGLIVQLSRNWRASTLASHRLDNEEAPEMQEFSPVFFGDGGACEQGERYCYQVLLSRLGEDDREFSIGAVHREFGETLQLFFNRDFFSRLESLYMVRGDRVPELQLGLTRRLSPKVLTRLESNLAAGGGGRVQTAGEAPYENHVRYLVTSLDTRFEETDTGVFVAFHRLQQQLDPIAAQPAAATEAAAQVDLERLQLSLTQDLGILRHFAWDWALHLNMELSRGSTPETAARDDEELRKRLTGGIAVRF